MSADRQSVPRDGAREAVARNTIAEIIDPEACQVVDDRAAKGWEDNPHYTARVHDALAKADAILSLRLSPEREGGAFALVAEARQMCLSGLLGDAYGPLGKEVMRVALKLEKAAKALSPEDGRGKEGPSSELGNLGSGAVAGTETASVLIRADLALARSLLLDVLKGRENLSEIRSFLERSATNG